MSLPNGRKMDNGTILVLRVTYPRNPSKVWTYVALKEGDRWFMTGQGNVPREAGWGRVEKWASGFGREVVSVSEVTEVTRIGDTHTDLLDSLQDTPFIHGSWVDDIYDLAENDYGGHATGHEGPF